MTNSFSLRLTIITIALTLGACATLNDFSKSLNGLSKLEFKISGLENMSLAGVPLSKVNNLSSLSIADGISLANAFGRKSLPTRFVLNVDARNPNNGSGTSSVPLTLNGFDWQLLIDGKRTISGDIARPIDIPGTTANTTIPLAVEMDLYQFFAERGYDGMVNLALALGGVQGTTSKVKLDAQPSVGTPFGQMTYPGRLTIVDSEFRDK